MKNIPPESGYDAEGYNAEGYNAEGYDAEGYDEHGYDQEGYDQEGYDQDGYDRNGYDAEGYDENGYDRGGYNAEGYNAEGYNWEGYDAEGYDENGYDETGYDRGGYDAEGNTRADRELIGEYHSSRRYLGHIPSPADKESPRILMGLELEMECKSKIGVARIIKERVGQTETGENYARCENDGSLDNGLEMVTGYTGLDVHAVQLKKLLPLAGARSHDTSTCGLHVHICKNNMTLFHAAKLVLFINNPENDSLIYALARRRDNGYAAIKNKKEDFHWLRNAMGYRDHGERLQHMNDASRYEALNFRNWSTIEFRLFKGTLKYETIMACLEFSRICWHFTKDASANCLTTAAFLAYIARAENLKDTRYLRGYLTEKGIKNA